MRRGARAGCCPHNVFGDLPANRPAIGWHASTRTALGDTPDRELVRLAEQDGLAPAALSAHAIVADSGPGLLLSFTNTQETQAENAARALLRAIGDRVGRAV